MLCSAVLCYNVNRRYFVALVGISISTSDSSSRWLTEWSRQRPRGRRGPEPPPPDVWRADLVGEADWKCNPTRVREVTNQHLYNVDNTTAQVWHFLVTHFAKVAQRCQGFFLPKTGIFSRSQQRARSLERAEAPMIRPESKPGQNPTVNPAGSFFRVVRMMASLRKFNHGFCS